MSKRGHSSAAPTSNNNSMNLDDGTPPFLPLEETMRIRSGGMNVPLNDSNNDDNHYGDDDYNDNDHSHKNDGSHKKDLTSKHSDTNNDTTTKAISSNPRPWLIQRLFSRWNTKKFILICMALLFVTIIWESFFVEPNQRWIQPDFCDQFLSWVDTNPTLGMGAILLVIAVAVVSMVPIGTPLTLGCGFIYRGVYGWKLGLFVSTVVSMAGSTLGAVACFLLGRYLMRDTVKRWVRNYPLFDAIDVAASDHGLKIMAMLYLTPVLPLGLVSYACGTTTMDVSSFALAKIASLPLYLLYTFIGASAHSFIKRGGPGDNKNSIGQSVSEEAKKLEENQFVLIAGLILSIVMMTLITRHIRRELMKILDQQKKERGGDSVPLLVSDPSSHNVNGDEVDDKSIELGLTARRKTSSKVAK